MAIAKLSIDLEARFATFTKELERATSTAEKNAQRLSVAFGLVSSAVTGLVAGIGVSGLVALARRTVDSVDALNDLKDATGSSIENISALEDVAARTGTSMDTVSTSLVKFNAALSDAKPGSDAARAFEAIGLSVADLKSLDPAEALRQTAVALAGFADDGNKARLTQELFGKSLKDVAPFLADLATKSELVGTVTTAAAAEAEKFNQELFALEKTAMDLTRLLVGPLVKAINDTAAAFRAGAKEGKGFFELGWDRYVENVKGFYRSVGLLEDRRPKFTLDFDQSAAESARLARQAEKRSVGDPFGDSKTGGKKGGKSQAEEVRAITTELDRYLVSLQRQLESTLELTEVQKAQARIAEAGAQGFSEAQRNEILRLAERIDKERELTAAMEERRREQDERIRIGRQLAIEQGVDNSARAAQLASLLDATPSAELERTRAAMVLLTEEFEAGRLSEERYLEAVKARLGITDKSLEKTKSLAEDLGLTFESAFEDAIVGGKKFSDVLKGLEQDILRMVTRQFVTKPLADSLGKALGGGEDGGLLGGIGKFFTGLFNFEGGGFTGSGPRAGGLDGRGGMLAMVHPDETVIDHRRGQSAGNTVNITVQQSFASGTSRGTMSQAAAAARRQLEFGARNL